MKCLTKLRLNQKQCSCQNTPAKRENRGPEHLQENHSFSFENSKLVDYQNFKIAKKIFLRKYQIEMEMQFPFDEMTTSLVSPAYFSS